MAPSHKDNTIKEIKKQIQDITGLNIEKQLVKAEQLGQYKFVERENEFALMFQLLKEVNDLDLIKVPFNLLQQLNRQLVSLWGIISSIKNFNLEDGKDFQRNKDGLINRFDQEEEKSAELVNEVIQIAKLFSPTDKGDTEVKIEDRIKAVNARAEEIFKFLGAVENQANEALMAIHTKTSQTGVSAYAEIFDTQSKQHRTASFLWLTGTALFLIVTIVYAFLLLYYFPIAISANELVQMTITKVIIITALFLGLSLCVRNFRAQKHNQILNRHRHNALRTFEQFTAASSDPETKNAVLLEATRSIFSNQTTGYHTHESADSDFPSKIIEIVKSAKSH